MAADRLAVAGGDFLAEHSADPHCVHSPAGAAAALCADQAADRPAPGGLRDDLWFDHALHVPAGGFWQHLPQRDSAGQRQP
ncbi:hypothetical protein D9M73_189400 [compost metagenome]